MLRREASRTVLLAFLGLAGYGEAAGPDGAPPAAWTSYLGTHYGARAWAQGVRDPGGAGRAGYNPTQDPAAALSAFGDLLSTQIAPLLPSRHLVLAAGGLGAGRDQAGVDTFMDQVAADAGAAFREALRQRARAVAGLSSAAEQVHWQFGNEINSQRFSETLHGWARDGAPPRANDTTTIPWIVEYYLVPGVAGVEQASREAFGDEGRINIMLGSIASAGNPNAQAFLAALLDYRIEGKFDPRYQGLRVYELVHDVSIHYTLATPGDTWRTFLDGLHQQRVGQGRVRAVWSTEEVGTQAATAGRGMAAAVKTLGRYLHWWQVNGLSPAQGHVYFWGTDQGPRGTSVDELFPALHAFLGDVPLVPPPSGPAALVGSSNLESYEWESGAERKRVLFLFASDGLAATAASAVGRAAGWRRLSATLRRYTTGGEQVSAVPARLEPDGSYHLDLGALSLGEREAAVVLIEE